MAEIVNRHRTSTSTHWLTKAIRVFSDADEATALALLHRESSVRPEYDLATDGAGRSLLVLSPHGYKTLTTALTQQGVDYEDVEVRPMSDLSAERQRRARGLAD